MIFSAVFNSLTKTVKNKYYILKIKIKLLKIQNFNGQHKLQLIISSAVFNRLDKTVKIII